MIRRQAGAKELLVGVAPGYLDSCYRDYGMEKMKLGKPVVPNLRETLDGPPEPPLSTEAYQRYRRSLGKDGMEITDSRGPPYFHSIFGYGPTCSRWSS